MTRRRTTKKDKDKIEVETSLVYTAPKANPEGLLFRIKEGKLTSTNPTKGTSSSIRRTGESPRPKSASN